MKPILFLDVDGVLNTRVGSLDEDKIQLLKEIVDQTGCEIVLSSSWRKNTIQRQRILMICHDIGARVIGVTPVLEAEARGLFVSESREAEIRAWLETTPNRAAFPWAVLDDEDMPGFANHHVRTDFKEGLTIMQAKKVIQNLRG